MTAETAFQTLPVDVDLATMDYFPLHDQRLMRSRAWLRAKNWRGDGPGLGFVLMNLWFAAFRAVPAGSIEDDEDYLADIAQVSIEHWRACKDKAMTGWHLIAGRWHHPVVSTLAWTMWLTRLHSRHEAALRAWKASAKRAMDGGREPPPQPPERFIDWCQIAYPASAARVCVTETAPPAADGVTVTDAVRNRDNGPKQSKGKEINPPINPPGRVTGTKAGKEWFNAQERALMHDFGADAMTLRDIAAGEKPKVSPRFALVNRFADCWVDRRLGPPVLVFPAKARADAFEAERGALMREHLPQWRVRHATVDELRARKQERENG